MRFLEYLIEKQDNTAFPEALISELKKLIKQGAKDTTQQWKDALELVRKAYHVAGVRIPLPTKKAAWLQFEELISTAVRELSKTRGMNGKWRTTTALVAENVDRHEPMRKNRIFVTIPGHSPTEVHFEDEKGDLDTALIQLQNKLKSSGVHTVVTKRDEDMVELTTYVRDSVSKQYVKRDVITIQQY